MRRVSYVWAFAAAACFAGAVEVVAPVFPALLLTAPLTLAIAQIPAERRRAEAPRTPRPPRSELDRHLERRARRGEAD